ncbi:hypothetical protein WT21_13905 [Burkholderia territorii]|nr:hypothetical protein WS79_10755 [Burkholderia territorii]KVQ48129.1 hypothetical protein WT21_13905 [Burkholderia territorii]
MKRRHAHCASRCGLAPRFGTSLTGRRPAPAETSPMLKLVRVAFGRAYTFVHALKTDASLSTRTH